MFVPITHWHVFSPSFPFFVVNDEWNRNFRTADDLEEEFLSTFRCSKSNSKTTHRHEIFSIWIRFRSLWNRNHYSVLCKCVVDCWCRNWWNKKKFPEKESKFSFEVFLFLSENYYYCSNFHISHFHIFFSSIHSFVSLYFLCWKHK